ncbi:MAG: GerMN domain-containing protein [Trueperaceae bacterium]|nr:GerMN domain-containing protein [Trueperaceae bacterium]MCO5175085.1 GerMN domain-containing protein [Trueperaceae bacterium]MCW5820859.1 GerMN domain-containing protein [Trueperaceae bacterium]
MRTAVLRVVALAMLLLLSLVGVIAVRTMQRVPDTVVYFVRDQGTTFTLEGVNRRLGRQDPSERAAAQVAALARGPTADEVARGLHSSVPADTALLGASFAGGTLTVDLSGAFERGGGTAAMLARLNQLFYTLTQPADVSAVRLLLDGAAVTVFSADGLLVDDPWVRGERAGLPVW